MPTKPILSSESLNKEIIRWAREHLLSHGYVLKSDLPESVQNTPWSYVARFITADGYIYLKHTPKLLALEAPIIQILYNQFNAFVPEVIVHNAELNCFLMKDAGRALREVLKKQFDAELFCKAIDQFTFVQLSVADDVNIFLDIGVPDWRLNKLPGLYEELLAQEDLLMEDGLSKKEINELKMMSSLVAHLCNELSAYSIKQTIVQPDFNDNNVLINDKSQQITIIDLGEIVISHPFFSLLNGLQQIKKHHALADNNKAYLQIREVCIKNYMIFESKENLWKAFKLAHPLWLIYGGLARYRLINACGKSRIMSYQQGKLIDSLREFKAAYVAIKN